MTVPESYHLDHAEIAFRKVACLGDDDRARFASRFNSIFGKCTPPLTVHFTEGKAPPEGT